MIPVERSVEAELQQVLAQILSQADQIDQQIQAGQSVDGELEQLDALLQRSGTLFQQLPADQPLEVIARLQQQGQEALASLERAQQRARQTLQTLAESLDRNIQGQRGNRAYRMVGS